MAKTFNEHRLTRIVEFLLQRRRTPACGQIRANDAEIPARQFLAFGRVASRGGAIMVQQVDSEVGTVFLVQARTRCRSLDFPGGSEFKMVLRKQCQF